MARFYPHVTSRSRPPAILAVMAVGRARILAIPIRLNVAALAGSAALEQHFAETVQDYAEDLDQAHQNALAAQSLLPDIQRAKEHFAQLAAPERHCEALTDTTGSGSAVSLL